MRQSWATYLGARACGGNRGGHARCTLTAFAASCWRGPINGLLTLFRGGGRAVGGSWFGVSLKIKDSARALAAGVILLSAGVTLSGCNDVAANPPNADAQAQFALRDDANMANATVAIASVDGAPADVSARFRQSLDEAAAAHRIAVVGPAKARYLVRGYLTASSIEGGAEVDVV